VPVSLTFRDSWKARPATFNPDSNVAIATDMLQENLKEKRDV
jgi:hypothetical protein